MSSSNTIREGEIMIDELIKIKVLAKHWTFTEISNLKQTIEDLSSEVYSEMKLSERFELVRETKINDAFIGMAVEDVFRDIALTQVKADVAGTIREMLDTATVDFGGKNEIPERSVGRKSHQERPADEEEDSSVEE